MSPKLLSAKPRGLCTLHRRMGLWILLAASLSGCVEYEINKDADHATGGVTPLTDTAEPDTAPPDTDPEPDPEEEEDTGGNVVEELEDDTGFSPPDTGIPEDEPEACEDPELSTSVPVDETCMSTPVTGEMSSRVEWAVSDFTELWEYREILMAPVVGHLTDDNGDGEIGDGDIPDIVFVTDDGGYVEHFQGVLRVISGDGTSDHLSLMVHEFDGGQVLIHRYSGVALGDIDDDGVPEIVTMVEYLPTTSGEHEGEPVEEPDFPVGPPPPPDHHDEDDGAESAGMNLCYPAAFDVEGNLEWLALEAGFDCGGHTPALADLEGDGDVEVIIGATIIEGTDGSLVAIGSEGTGRYLAYEEIGAIVSIVDLDLDGFQEIIAGRTLYDPMGEVICSLPDPELDGFTAAADLDGDGLGEFVVVGNGLVVTAEDDCSILNEWSLLGTGTGGPPTIADFDADGHPEIGVASATHYAVYEPDGTLVWSRAVTDASSHATGSTVFDFEGDGRPEVVYADEVALWILDGLTGDVRLSDTSHESRTLHEFPLVVDVDADGYPEIVVPNGGGHYDEADERTGLYVLGSGDDSWLGGRQVWNQHAYNIVNINDDLSIPSIPDANWPLYNNFRSGDLNPVAGENAPDAVPIAEACLIECADGVIVLGFRLGNAGTSTLRTDMLTTVYAVDWAGDRALTTLKISPPIAPGGTSDMEVFSVPADEVGAEGIRIVVDDDNGVSRVRECNEDNNELVLSTAVCP